MYTEVDYKLSDKILAKQNRFATISYLLIYKDYTILMPNVLRFA